jgi:hypothetical protein
MSISYLQIRGSLSDNMVYHPRPGEETARPQRSLHTNPEYALVLLDKDLHVLLSVTPVVSAPACGAEREQRRFRVEGILPLHPEGRSYELRKGSACLYSAQIPANPPHIESATMVEEFDGYHLTWSGTWPTQSTHSVIARMASKDIVLARGLTKTSFFVERTNLRSQGSGVLVLRTSDGVRSAEYETGSIRLPPKPPQLNILIPSQGAELTYGQPLSVIGTCLDIYGRPYALDNVIWTLDDTITAKGTLVLALHHVVPGSHRLVMSATSSEGLRAEAAVEFVVLPPTEDYRRWLTTLNLDAPGDPPALR